jgi:hypothetical protein
VHGADGSFQVQMQGLTFDGSTDILVEVGADELGGDTRTKLLHITHTESDLIQVASQTFSFETDMEGWQATHGTFVRKTGGGANGTNAHISSSEDLDDQCDVVQSPLFFLTDTSTLELRLRYDIEPQSGGQYWDRANISLVDAQSGDRVVLTPSGGRPYQVPDGSGNGTCGTSGQAGWDASTPGFPNLWYNATFNAAALNPGGASQSGRPAADQLRNRRGRRAQGLRLRRGDPDELLPPAGGRPRQRLLPEPLRDADGIVVDGAGNGVLEAGETAGVSPTWTNGASRRSTCPDRSPISAARRDRRTTFRTTPEATARWIRASPRRARIATRSRSRRRRGPPFTGTLRSPSRSAISRSSTTPSRRSGRSTSAAASATSRPRATSTRSSRTFFHNGVTAGCGTGTPSARRTRHAQQMAVFLLKAKEGAAYNPPACTTQVFDDVPCSSNFAPWINELSARGITAGCNATTYCPTDPTNRQQMAVFLLKTEEGSSFVPPDCTTQQFDDVPCSSNFARWINELVARGVTAGCGGNNYCPTNPVARQQMAVFLVKTFGLLLYAP